jgi:hypothetical protein
MRRAHTSARGITAWLLVCAAALGCSEPTREPTTPRADLSVAVVSEPIPASSSTEGVPNWAIFTVDVLLANPSDVLVRIPGCGPALEQETLLGGWTIVSEKMCALGAGDAIELPPRSERRSSETIITTYARSSFSGAASLGRYRLLYRFAPVGQVGPLDEARSEPFELK